MVQMPLGFNRHGAVLMLLALGDADIGMWLVTKAGRRIVWCIPRFWAQMISEAGRWEMKSKVWESETVASLFFLFIFFKDIGPSKLRKERSSIKGKSINQSIYFISLIKSRSVQIDSIVILTTLVFANSTLLFDSLTSSLKWKKKKEKKKRSRRSFMRKAIIHNNFAWLTLSNLQHKVSSLHPHMQA